MSDRSELCALGAADLVEPSGCVTVLVVLKAVGCLEVLGMQK